MLPLANNPGGLQMRRTIVLAVVAAAVFALGAGQAPARSYPTAVEYGGHWQGFFQSSLTSEIGTFALDLVPTHNRQLDGTLSSPTLPMSLPFHVTVAASNVFTAVSPGGNFVVHGNQDAFIWFERAGYRLRQGGMTDVGTLHFFKSFSELPAVQLPRLLEGTFERDDGQTGRILIGIHFQGGNDFDGVATFGGIPFPLPFLGSIGAIGGAGGTAPVRALSVSPAGTFLIKGNWIFDSTRPPHLDGMVNATFADGSVRFITFSLAPAVGTSG
jgi:prepilin-type processing-associated H-X9-DG protein